MKIERTKNPAYILVSLIRHQLLMNFVSASQNHWNPLSDDGDKFVRYQST